MTENYEITNKNKIITLVSGRAEEYSALPSPSDSTQLSLYLLIRDYCNTPKARIAFALRPYLPALRSGDQTLRNDPHFAALVEDAKRDPVMLGVQSAFFERVFA